MRQTFPTDELLQLWTQTIDADNVGTSEAMARDIAEFTGESVAQVLQKMKTGVDDLKVLWQSSGIDTTDPTKIENFYRDQFVEAYELANWHAGGTEEGPPLNYAWVTRFAMQKQLMRVLDFGSGIGTGSLCLASAGCEVHCADIAGTLLQFTGHRLKKRNFSPKLIDMVTSTPLENYYDLITCFDVLEHVPDQAATLLQLQSYLRDGGYLVVNFMHDSSDGQRPMHISSSGYWPKLIRRTELVPEWANCTYRLQVLRRVFQLKHIASLSARIQAYYYLRKWYFNDGWDDGQSLGIYRGRSVCAVPAFILFRLAASVAYRVTRISSLAHNKFQRNELYPYYLIGFIAARLLSRGAARVSMPDIPASEQ